MWCRPNYCSNKKKQQIPTFVKLKPLNRQIQSTLFANRFSFNQNNIQLNVPAATEPHL